MCALGCSLFAVCCWLLVAGGLSRAGCGVAFVCVVCVVRCLLVVVRRLWSVVVCCSFCAACLLCAACDVGCELLVAVCGLLLAVRKLLCVAC